LHLAVDAFGMPVRIIMQDILIPADCTQASHLTEGITVQIFTCGSIVATTAILLLSRLKFKA
jgi:hypothetical protein